MAPSAVFLVEPESEMIRTHDQEILDLVAAHDEREMAKLLLDERARVREARSILAELLPTLASRPSSAPGALLRARAFIGD